MEERKSKRVDVMICEECGWPVSMRESGFRRDEAERTIPLYVCTNDECKHVQPGES